MILHQLPVPTKENNDEVAIIVVTVAEFTYFVCQLWLSLTDETVASISKPRLLNSFFVFVIAVMLVGSVLYYTVVYFVHLLISWKIERFFFIFHSIYLWRGSLFLFFCNAIFLFIYLTFSFLDTLWFYTNWLYECILWAWASSKYLQSIDFMDQH